MPSLNIGGGGTARELFVQSVMSKIYGGVSTPTVGHIRSAAQLQYNLRKRTIQDSNGDFYAMGDDSAFDGTEKFQ